MAEREGFEPPIGLHLCRISSAVHSTTLPPLLKAPSKEQGPCGSGVNRRGWRARQGLRGRKSAACFGPARPFPARTRGKGGPIAGLTRFCRARDGARFATPMRRHPLPGPPAIRLRPKAGFGETSAGERAHHRLGRTLRFIACSKKGVGPPDAVNTGGPVPLLEILAGKGGFAGQVRRRFRP